MGDSLDRYYNKERKYNNLMYKKSYMYFYNRCL